MTLSPRSDIPGHTQQMPVSVSKSNIFAKSPELNMQQAANRSQMNQSRVTINKEQSLHVDPYANTKPGNTFRSQTHSKIGGPGAATAMQRQMNSTGSTVYTINQTAAREIDQHKKMPLAYRSIQKFDQTSLSNQSRIIEEAKHPKDPQLLCTEKHLPENIEEEIKDGFFELKQKFKDVGPSSIYISHVVLHEKHPLLKKVDVETLKTLLLESSVIYLSVGQTLYRYGA